MTKYQSVRPIILSVPAISGHADSCPKVQSVKSIRKLLLLNISSCSDEILISILCNHREFYNRGCSRMVSDLVQTYKQY